MINIHSVVSIEDQVCKAEAELAALIARAKNAPESEKS